MRTKDIKCQGFYQYKGEEVIVLERIKGEETKKPCMQNGIMNVGYHRTRKKFRLFNGEIVTADKLKLIRRK